jgi:TolB-like protein/class 3 adenylate cyclase/cytochrome c-type biogenesis protein CcmH/NrfG
MSGEQRRLAAVMFTDMVGYTALGQRNESLSLALVEEQRKLIRPILARHNGREIKTIGDAFLVEFLSALDAVRCTYDIQRAVREFNISLPEERRVHLRVGVHLGDVVESGGDISGDAVNVASRIEPLAEDGGVCVTRQVFDHVQNKFELKLVSLGVKPLKNVSIPIEAFRMVMPWEHAGVSSRPESSGNRVAVLPFANMSPDPADEYFADGMTEELIDRLAQVKSLKVIARTSVMKYKGSQKGALEVGKELGIGALIEGSVRKAGNRVRVTVQLINAGTEEHLWSSHYDKNLDDIFAVQTEIAEKVAVELKTQLLDSEKQTLEKKPTENTEAYTCFLRGRELYREGETEASLRQAISLFEKAIELDPRFARAYVGVAECHQWLANGYEPYDISLSIVKTSLERAIDLDPNLPEAHASLSEMFFNEDDMPAMEAEARRALDLNPSLPEPYSMLSELAALKGDPGEMVRQNEIAYRLDPIRPRFIWLVGTAYLWTGREEEALELWKKTEQLAPAQTYRGMTEHYLIKGNLEKAKEFHAKAEKLEPTNPRVTWMGGAIAAMEGDRERALLAIRKIEDAKVGPLSFNYIGFVYHALEDLDSYFEYMKRALETHVLIPSIMMYSPLLARARADPRYLELMEKIRRQLGLTK